MQTIGTASAALKCNLNESDSAYDKFTAEICELTKERAELCAYREKLEKKTYSLKDELLRTRREYEELCQKENSCPGCDCNGGAF